MKMLLIILTLLGGFSGSTFASNETGNLELQPAESFVTEKVEGPEGLQPLHERGYPRQRMVVCSSQDHHGYVYSASGYLPREVQHQAHHQCEDYSRSDCWDLGCRYY